MSKNKIVIITELKKDQVFEVVDNEKKTFVILSCGEKDQSGEVRIIIRGKNANVQILGIIIGSGDQKIDIYTLQEHQKEGSISDLLVKSVLFGKSRLQYRGFIKIEKDAQKSNAYQKNQNLLMSKGTWADSRPILEILANDVRCTHGATIGKVDQEQLYYLMTRGLSEKSATNLIVSGFLQEVIDRIPDKSKKSRIEEKIKNRLAQLLSV